MNPDDPTTQPQGPERCTAAALVVILRDMLSRPHRLVLATEPPPVRTGSMWVGFGVWQVLFSWVNGRLTVQRASCPEALRPCSWWCGCERDDWTLGPGSKIVEPVALLTPEEQEQLVSALAAAEVDEPVGGYDMGPSLEVVVVKKKPTRRRAGGKELKWKTPWAEDVSA
jgi:hypothetical protein